MRRTLFKRTYWKRVRARAWSDTRKALSLHPHVVIASILAWTVLLVGFWWFRDWHQMTDQVFTAVLGAAGVAFAALVFFLFHYNAAPAKLMEELEAERDFLEAQKTALEADVHAAQQPDRRGRIEEMRRQVDQRRATEKRRRRLEALERLAELRTKGHRLLSILEFPVQRPGMRVKTQEWHDAVISQARVVSESRAFGLDAAFLVDERGNEVRNVEPGVAPADRFDLALFARTLLRRLDRFLEEAEDG